MSSGPRILSTTPLSGQKLHCKCVHFWETNFRLGFDFGIRLNWIKINKYFFHLHELSEQSEESSVSDVEDSNDSLSDLPSTEYCCSICFLNLSASLFPCDDKVPISRISTCTKNSSFGAFGWIRSIVNRFVCPSLSYVFLKMSKS